MANPSPWDRGRSKPKHDWQNAGRPPPGDGGSDGGRSGGGGPRWGRLWAFLAGIGVLLLVLHLFLPSGLFERGDGSGLVRALIILLAVGGAVALFGRARRSELARSAALWGLIIAILVLGYTFRRELGFVSDRVTASFVPERGYQDGDGMVFERGPGGHFHIDALVDGTSVRFLVDTGATDVVLSPDDAARLGLALDRRDFTRPYSTANGIVFGAPIQLDQIAVGPIVVRDVRASVNGAVMDRSLLGMSFLNRLRGFEVTGDRLILKP